MRAAHTEFMLRVKSDVDHISTPRSISIIKSEANSLKKSLLKEWEEKFEKFNEFPAYHQGLEEFEVSLRGSLQ